MIQETVKLKEKCPNCRCKEGLVKNEGLHKLVVCARCGAVRKIIDVEEEWFG